MKKIQVAIIGAGNRGGLFGELMQERKDEFEIAAVCDIEPKQLVKCKLRMHLTDEQLFSDEKTFFEKKRGDLMVVATYDRDHVRQCIAALKLGYDVLLEKPISDSREELRELIAVQKETGRKVIVCHELRYGAGYVKAKELLQEGVIGQLLTIDAMERVVYWHQAQAYVRIQSAYNELTHPTILAKCSHDLDLIQSYAGAPCETVSSIGGLSYFRESQAPKDSTEYCLDCPHVDTCPYSAKKVYIERWHALGEPDFIWPFNKVSLKVPTTEEDLYEGLRTTYFGKCVFHCHNEAYEHVVDHQLVQMQFANGVQAVLKMVFASTSGRRINFFGTLGEILLDERTDTIEVRLYGKEPEIIPLNTLVERGHNHGGGDNILVSRLYGILTDQTPVLTSLTESAESHLMGISAEESRLNGGVLVKVHQ